MIAYASTFPDTFHRPRSPFVCSVQRFGFEQAWVLLQKCNDFNQLKQIHARIIRSDLSHNQLLVRQMNQVCCSCGNMAYASLAFERLERPGTFTWNIMIRDYAASGNLEKAILLYNDMVCRGFVPDKFTFPFVAKACTRICLVDKGKEVHGFAIKAGFFYKDLFIQNTLMDLYFKCGEKDCGRMIFEKMSVRSAVSLTTMLSGLVASGDLDSAKRVFEEMPGKNVISWTAMIDGFVRNGEFQEAFTLFRQMQLDGVMPNEFTLVSLLKACSEFGSLELGKWIHNYAKQNGFELGVFLGTALIDMYSKCGSLMDAKRSFLEMESKSLATWNAMITSLGVHGFGGEALALFGQMVKSNVLPDGITFVGVLSACVQTSKPWKASKLFRYMTECCGIAPLTEHYTRLTEAYNRANENVPVNSHNYVMTSFGTNAVQVGTSTFGGRELPCIKWDVG